LSGGEVRSHRIRGGIRAHLSWKVMFRAVGHMAAPELTSAMR
jgi:hypothetical protein